MKKQRFVPTLEFLNHLFFYNRKLGILSYKNPKRSITKKISVGAIHRGYIEVEIKGSCYRVHQLIWFIEKGNWPKMIDHINGIKHDNRIENLRECDSRLNQMNRASHRKGKLVGCYFNKISQGWTSRTLINGKRLTLGTFKTEKQAHEAYINELKTRGLI